MRRTTRDDNVQAAFDRYHATAGMDREAAERQLRADMRRAGGPVPRKEKEQ